ncbi:MAG TPA: hypothetical protein VFM18_19850 [Methanosarcina sp.]|nr:hypothetical protein [Methanosarcina sp.]
MSKYMNKQDKKSLSIIAGVSAAAFVVSFPITSLILGGMVIASGYGFVKITRIVIGQNGGN